MKHPTKKYKSNVFSTISDIHTNIIKRDSIDPQFLSEYMSECRFKEIVESAIVEKITDLDDIPVSESKLSIYQTYEPNSGEIDTYQYIIKGINGKIRKRFEKPLFEEEHYHIHDDTGKEIKKRKHPRPSINQIFSTAEDIKK
jgi:hypothetical protein